MKKTVMTTLVLLLVVTTTAPVAHSRRPQGPTKASLERTVTAFFEVVKANDLDELRNYYTTDYTFIGQDGKLLGIEERLKGLKQAGGSSFLTASEVKVRIYGNTGVVTGIASTRTLANDTEQSRFTQTWTWQVGRWRLAASQVTRID